MHTENEKQIVGRFFEALDTLLKRKDIAGVQTYCTKYNINKRNLYTQRKKPETRIMHFDWITPMITEYGVSSLWILTGIGKMFLPSFEKESAKA